MASRRYVLFLVLLALLSVVVGCGRGGGRRGDGGGSKSGKSPKAKRGGGGGSTYPKQDWSPAPAPPSPPSDPNQPVYNPNNPQGPRIYHAPGQHHPAPPIYTASGPINPPEGDKGGIGSRISAGVAEAAIGRKIKGPKGPKIRIYTPIIGHDHHNDSSSEEYFEPYIVGPDGRYRLPPSRPGYQLTPEGEQIYRSTVLMNNLCHKLQQPSACAMLRLQGVKPFTQPNSIFNMPEESRPNHRPHTIDLSGQNNTVVLNNSGVFVDNKATGNSTTTTVVEGPKLYPTLPDPAIPPVPAIPKDTSPTAVEDTKLHPSVIGPVAPPLPGVTTEPPHLSEDRLKAADDMFKVLDGL